MKTLFYLLLLSGLIACTKEKTILHIKSGYSRQIIGSLYSGGVKSPIQTFKIEAMNTIEINDLLEGTYQISYYCVPFIEGYIPKDTAFQIHEGQTREIIIK